MTKIEAFLNDIYKHAIVYEEDGDLPKMEIITSFCPRDMDSPDRECSPMSYEKCLSCWERPENEGAGI